MVCSSDFEKEDEVKDHMNLHEIPEAYEKGRYIHTQGVQLSSAVFII